MRLAALLYSTGAARTKREAAQIAGIAPEYFTTMSNHNDQVRRIVGQTQETMDDEAVATSVLIQRLGRKALMRLSHLMDNARDEVAFRAAQDLADRAPDTSKVQRVQVDQFTLGGEDVRAIAAAMIESSKHDAEYADVALNGLVEVEIDKPQPHLRLIEGRND